MVFCTFLMMAVFSSLVMSLPVHQNQDPPPANSSFTGIESKTPRGPKAYPILVKVTREVINHDKHNSSVTISSNSLARNPSDTKQKKMMKVKVNKKQMKEMERLREGRNRLLQNDIRDSLSEEGEKMAVETHVAGSGLIIGSNLAEETSLGIQPTGGNADKGRKRINRVLLGNTGKSTAAPAPLHREIHSDSQETMLLPTPLTPANTGTKSNNVFTLLNSRYGGLPHNIYILPASPNLKSVSWNLPTHIMLG